jgi:hypothetical protein
VGVVAADAAADVLVTAVELPPHAASTVNSTHVTVRAKTLIDIEHVPLMARRVTYLRCWLSTNVAHRRRVECVEQFTYVAHRRRVERVEQFHICRA